jgi:ABC-type methionine transport system permease subunit
MLCVFIGGRGFGDLWFRIGWDQFSSEALLVKVYTVVTIVQLSLQVFKLVDVALTGIYNFKVQHPHCVSTTM